MASILKVDAMQGVTSAGDITITSEGGAATQSLQQGLAKAWSNIDGTGTVSARDSLNTSSITDNAVGDYSTNFTNSLDNVNGVASSFAGSGTVANQVNSQSFQGLSTSALRTLTFVTGSNAFDRDYILHLVHGDLA